jgi:hypothetical protein
MGRVFISELELALRCLAMMLGDPCASGRPSGL